MFTIEWHFVLFVDLIDFVFCNLYYTLRLCTDKKWLYDKMNTIMYYFTTFNCVFLKVSTNIWLKPRPFLSPAFIESHTSVLYTTFGQWEVLLGLLPLIFVCSYQFRISRCKWSRWVADNLIVNDSPLFFTTCSLLDTFSFQVDLRFYFSIWTLCLLGKVISS